jgi:ubiquitin carboxyl-terminal hydrolase 36/42
MNVRALNDSFTGCTDVDIDIPLDLQLASSSQELLQQRIRFVEARRPDSHYEELKKRYKPINDPVDEKSASSSSSFGHNRVDSDVKCDGVGEPRVELFPSERIEMQWKAPRRVGAGLANLGNTCFLNSVLQCLSYTAPLVNYLQSGEHTRQCKACV